MYNLSNSVKFKVGHNPQNNKQLIDGFQMIISTIDFLSQHLLLPIGINSTDPSMKKIVSWLAKDCIFSGQSGFLQ